MSSRYDLVLFDLDGTLTDSGPGILNTLVMALEKHGRPVPEPDVRRTFIGPPLQNQLHAVFRDMTREESEAIVRTYRERYDAAGVYENKVYAGIPELLDELRARGAKLAVATSKPMTPAYLVLDHFDLTRHFDYISAADNSDYGGGKEELILPVLRKSGVPASRAVMIGDTKYDIRGAVNSGTDFVGVLYGFGTREEMELEGGRTFVNTVDGLRKFLIDKFE